MAAESAERHCMQKEDKRIDEERERERKSESENSSQIIQTTINHFSHPHPLIYLESDHDHDDATFSCNSCSKPGRGKTYHCNQCNNFNLHITCALAPLTFLLSPQQVDTNGAHREVITTTFVHPVPDHPMATQFKTKKFKCILCKGTGNGLRFRCERKICKLNKYSVFHPVCAKNPTRLTSHFYPDHELELRLSPLFKKCELCGDMGAVNNRMYTCTDCDFYIHPGCTQWPLYLIHPSHPPHPLMLTPVEETYMYRCGLCEVGFSLDYVLQPSTLGENEGDEQVRTKYAGQNITLLPAINLIPPGPSKRWQHVPPVLEPVMAVLGGVVELAGAFSG